MGNLGLGSSVLCTHQQYMDLGRKFKRKNGHAYSFLQISTIEGGEMVLTDPVTLRVARALESNTCPDFPGSRLRRGASLRSNCV